MFVLRMITQRWEQSDKKESPMTKTKADKLEEALKIVHQVKMDVQGGYVLSKEDMRIIRDILTTVVWMDHEECKKED